MSVLETKIEKYELERTHAKEKEHLLNWVRSLEYKEKRIYSQNGEDGSI